MAHVELDYFYIRGGIQSSSRPFRSYSNPSDRRREHDRLKVVNKTPIDVVDKVLDIFQTSSIKDFNTVFKTLKLNVRLKISSGYTLEYIFHTAETFYREIQETHKWVDSRNDKSIFNNSTFVTCWNCSEDGYVICICPKSQNRFLP